jgi:hypothetical protein
MFLRWSTALRAVSCPSNRSGATNLRLGDTGDAIIQEGTGEVTLQKRDRAASLQALRRLCLAFPDTSERLSHGEPTWFIRGKKTFVTFADHHHDDRLAFWCAAPPGAQDALVASAPGRYFVPPYVGHRGWLGISLTTPSAQSRRRLCRENSTKPSPRNRESPVPAHSPPGAHSRPFLRMIDRVFARACHTQRTSVPLRGLVQMSSSDSDSDADLGSDSNPVADWNGDSDSDAD